LRSVVLGRYPLPPVGHPILLHAPVAIAPPPRWLTLAEGPRALAELAALPMAAPWLAAAPRGDGHGVLVLPGFVSNDNATAALRRYLRALGHDAQGWELGLNLGRRSIGAESERLLERLEAVRAATGRPVSLVGWSLGGVMARQLARAVPGDVRQIVTLGSPFTGNPHATSIARLYERVSGDRIDDAFVTAMLAESRTPPPVPSTAIYSRGDGIVAWRNCVEPVSATTDNIRVRGSHVGLPFNPAVWFAVADRLALPEGQWRRFDRSGWRRSVYPAP
jgi:pimeloyl-ACP methyl ester carboxylesterase